MASSVGSGKPPIREEVPLGREVDVLRRAVGLLSDRLPASWTLHVEEEARRADAGFDALLVVEAPDGSSITLAVEAKRLLVTRDVSTVLEQLQRAVDVAGLSPAVPMVVARYLAPSTRERLANEGAAYADATGNLRIAIDRPALFLSSSGEDRDPWRGPGRPRGTLKGAPAARVVRALVDFLPPVTVPQLVERSGASTGATYRVVTFLEEEGLVERKPRGPITTVAWRRLIERWAQDYTFQNSDSKGSFLFPRGVEAVTERLRTVTGFRYVVTGSPAAAYFAPYAPVRVAMIYVDDIATATERLDLRSVDRGANVLLAANRDDVSFARARVIDGVSIAAPSQIAVDLLTGPGRNPSEGTALLDWMEANEHEWRS